jgi:hypothetical protein
VRHQQRIQVVEGGDGVGVAVGEVASAGWALATGRVAGKPDGLDLDGLLDTIEAQLQACSGR